MVRACTLLSYPRAQPRGAMRSLPQLGLNSTRAQVLEYFENTWALTEMLFSGLASEEAFYRRPAHQLRHPMIFYYAHPVALYVNKLRVAGLLDKPVRPEFEALFETGVDEMRWDDLHEEQEIWPPLSEVKAYRREVYALIRAIIEHHPLLEPQHMPITQDSPLWALVMGFEHERIHLETSSVLLRELPVECVKRPADWPEFHAFKHGTGKIPRAGVDYDENAFVAVPETVVSPGKPQDYPTFGWDNEYGSAMRRVAPFAAGEGLISNGEFHAFVAAGGYREERWWTPEGWAWRQFRNSKWPSFWVPDGPAGLNQFRLRTTFEVVEMQWCWPVCVNFHEAKAYAAWMSEREGKPFRLLTEAEHHALRDGREHRYNLDLSSGGENSVHALPANAKGFHDVFGNVWQWCEDHFHPLPGFAPHPYYDDFSTPCFDGEHQMMLGGSFISTGDEASPFARFHFRPHFFQHAGFRLVQAAGCEAEYIGASAATYEKQEIVDRYMLMHWGSGREIYDAALQQAVALPQVAHLPVRAAELAAQFATQSKRALDLGCAVGRSSFELARHFAEVLGVDYSREFVAAASALQSKGALPYLRKDTGAESTRLIAGVDPSIDRARVRFEHGDACALPPHIHGFDAVLLANVLCRLPDPAACLKRMQGRDALVQKGGVLVMTTPFTWLEEYTPKDRWLKGVDDIQRLLPGFELLHQEEVPFLIREHRRKFEYIIALATVWRRS